MPKQIDYSEIAKSLEANKDLSLEAEESALLNGLWDTTYSIDYDSDKAFKKLESKMLSISPKKTRTIWYAAAAILVTVAFGIYSYLSPTVYTTNNGEIVSITLPDNSVVKLEGGSKLEVSTKFGDDDRVIKLNGLAEFKVSKNPNKAFVVESPKGVVKVLGTTFQIMDYAKVEGYNLGVTEGRVELTVEKNDKIVLTANQSAMLLADKMVLNSNTSNPNKLIFKNTTVIDLVQILEKKYGEEIVFEKSIANTKLNIAVEDSLSLSSILEILSETTDKTFSIK